MFCAHWQRVFFFAIQQQFVILEKIGKIKKCFPHVILVFTLVLFSCLCFQLEMSRCTSNLLQPNRIYFALCLCDAFVSCLQAATKKKAVPNSESRLEMIFRLPYRL